VAFVFGAKQYGHLRSQAFVRAIETCRGAFAHVGWGGITSSIRRLVPETRSKRCIPDELKRTRARLARWSGAGLTGAVTIPNNVDDGGAEHRMQQRNWWLMDAVRDRATCVGRRCGTSSLPSISARRRRPRQHHFHRHQLSAHPQADSDRGGATADTQPASQGTARQRGVGSEVASSTSVATIVRVEWRG
jgi:hypothetical protein